MDRISSDIKNGNIKRVYLFYGEDVFKRRVYKNALKKALFSNEMNYSYYEGEGINWKNVYDAAYDVPFFAPRRLVIVENSGIFKSKGMPGGAKGSEDFILEMIKNLPETTCLAFFETEAAKNRKAFKEIAKNGDACECGHDNEKTVAVWLEKGFAEAGKKISRADMYYIIERVGTDYEQLKKEFDKIDAYTGDAKTVKRSDIEAVTGNNVDAKVYELVNECVRKDPKAMLEKYYALLENDVYPLIILASLRGQFELMLQIAELSNRSFSDAEIAKKTGKAEFVIRNTKRLISSFRLSEIEEIIEEISRTDKNIKDGDINERTGVEILLLQICA